MATSKLISDVEFEEYESSLKTLNDNLEKAESDKDAASNKVEASKKIIKERFGSVDKFMSMVQPIEKDEIVPPGNTSGLLSRNI